MGNETSSTSTSSPHVKNVNTWTLFVCNAYLIPPFTVNKDNATCINQDERAAALGRVIMRSNPDIVMLQEAWGAGMEALEKNITPTYSIGKYCRSWFGSTVIDSVLQYANARGGLYFANNVTTCVNSNRPTSDANDALSWRSYSTSKTKSKKGMVCVKYQKIEKASEEEESQQEQQPNENKARRQVFEASKNQKQKISTLLVFNTHLDPTNQDNVQLQQLRDLGAFIRDVIDDEHKYQKNKSDFGAVLVGDFNFTSSCPQYKEMWKIMKEQCGVEVTEMLSSAAQNTPTYSPKNPLVQWPSSAGRIDQIFGISSVSVALGDSGLTKNIVLNKVDLVQEKVRDDVVVSDHYPFEATLQMTPKDESSKDLPQEFLER